MTMTHESEVIVDREIRTVADLSKNRELAKAAVLTRVITIEAALKALYCLRENDAAGRAAVVLGTQTIKGTFFLSPNGQNVYGLKQTTRVIDGVKRSMMSIKSVTPVSRVLSFEAK